MTISITRSKQIIEIMSILTSDKRFVGKGGNIVIANVIGKTNMLRLSGDIDCTAVSFKDDNEILDCIKKMFPDKHVEITRNSGEKRTLQISVGDIPIDIETDKKSYYDIIKYSIYGSDVQGCSFYDILVDKITVLSSFKIFRRCKDLVDIYNISTNYNVDSKIFKELYNKSGRQIGDFSAFKIQKDNLEHAYSTLDLGEGAVKEDFSKVYETVERFADGIFFDGIWDHNLRSWIIINTGKNVLGLINDLDDIRK